MMDLYVAYKVGVAILEALMIVDLVRITWLALRHRRLSLPPAGLVNWFAEKRIGKEVVKQRLQRLQPWVKPYGYMCLVALFLFYSSGPTVIRGQIEALRVSDDKRRHSR